MAFCHRVIGRFQCGLQTTRIKSSAKVVWSPSVCYRNISSTASRVDMAPSTHKAYAVVQKGKAAITTKPVPKLDDSGILVKIHAVALNPTDWKHLDRMLEAGQSFGSDFAGTVVELGPSASGKGIEKGDEVAGYVRGGIAFGDKDNGAFQEYIRIYPELVFKKPSNISFEEAAGLALAPATASQALYQHLKIPKAWSSNRSGSPILIWSGATSVGTPAIQIAVLAGLKVITTSSPANFEYLKSLGASAVFDYKDPEVVEKIKEASGGGVTWALDTISEKGSTKTAAQCFASSGGKIVTLLPVKKEGDGWPENVEVEPTLIYSALDRNNKADFELLHEWYQHLPELVESGKLKPQKVRKFEGGMEGLGEALDYSRQGKVKAEKIALSW